MHVLNVILCYPRNSMPPIKMETPIFQLTFTPSHTIL